MPFSHNVNLVGYHDLNDRPGFKMGLQVQDDRWYLYLGHLWHPGWSVLDVTNPAAPELLCTIPGPEHTWTIQVQVADGKLITALERITREYGGDLNRPPGDEGFIIWDIATNPSEPRKLGQWHSGADGTHRNYYNGGRYVHATAQLPGYSERHYVAVNINDPTNPTVVGNWWWPGQHHGAGEQFSAEDSGKKVSLHGGAYVEGPYAYCGWMGAGVVILDVSDITAPHLAGHLGMNPPFANPHPVHTVVPLPDRQLAVINGESISERANEPLVMAGIVDVQDVSKPRLISIFPLPEPPEGYPGDFHQRGGRFGPHNQHQPQHNPWLKASDQYIYLTYFSAGLQIYDISNPYRPTIAGYYIPDDPQKRLGLKPSELVVQCEDVLVDRRGYIYMTEKNSGLYILEFNPR